MKTNDKGAQKPGLPDVNVLIVGVGPKNLTDLYLFDPTIRPQWVAGCKPDDLEVLAGGI